MMKWTVGTAAGLSLLLMALYLLLFTETGNGMVAPVIEQRINHAFSLESRIKRFTLDTSSFTLEIDLTPKNTLELSGDYDLMGLHFTAAYHVKFDRLDDLHLLTQKPLYGKFHAEGTLQGSPAQMQIIGQSDLAKSATDFTIELAQLKLKSITATLRHLRLGVLLHLLGQPEYADALVDLDIAILDARDGRLDGKITTHFSRGVLNRPVVEKTFAFKTMPEITFRGQTVTKLQKETVQSDGELRSSLADIVLKELNTDLAKKLTTASYAMKLHNLDHLYFATERHLRGKMFLTGTLKKAQDLDLTLHTDMLGGSIDATLHNDDLKADLHAIQTLDTLHMLIYPEVFKATLDGIFGYNLTTKQGSLDARLKEGKFTPNIMLDLVRQYGRTDLYLETFGGTLKSRIRQEQILSDLDLRSNRSSITAKEAKVNSKTKTVDARIDINANRTPLRLTVQGKSSDPKVQIDATQIIRKEANEQLQRLFQKLF